MLQQILLLITLIIAVVSLLWLGIRLGIQYFQMQDPYVQEVMAASGDGVRGQAIFVSNCAVCHGLEARGLVGPSLKGVGNRRSALQLINQVISGQTPPMPKFQPSPQEMADLLDYLEKI